MLAWVLFPIQYNSAIYLLLGICGFTMLLKSTAASDNAEIVEMMNGLANGKSDFYFPTS